MNHQSLIGNINALLNPLSRKLKILLQRAVTLRASYSGKIRMLQLQVEGGQPLSEVEHLEPFGFTSHPLSGSEAIALAFNGNGSHSVALLVGDHRYRLVIAEGETAIYNQAGDYVHIQNDGSISVSASQRVQLNTPEVICSGVLRAQDVISSAGVSLNSHKHNETNGTTTQSANPS